MTDGKGSPPFRIELGLRGEAGAGGPARWAEALGAGGQPGGLGKAGDSAQLVE